MNQQKKKILGIISLLGLVLLVTVVITEVTKPIGQEYRQVSKNELDSLHQRKFELLEENNHLRGFVEELGYNSDSVVTARHEESINYISF